MISIETLRTHRHSRAAILADPDILLIRRGYRVRLHGDQDARPWEIWQSINIARLHALDYQSSQRLVFTGNSALLLHGIPTWSTNSCVEAWPSKSDFQLRPYPAVQHRHTVVPGVPVICRNKAPQSISQIDGLEAESPVEAVVRLTLNEQPRDAFVAACMVMHSLSGFDRFNLGDSRESASISDVTCSLSSADARTTRDICALRRSSKQLMVAVTMFSRPRFYGLSKACTRGASSRSIRSS